MVQHDEAAADIPARGTPDPDRTERIEDSLSRLRKIEGQVRGLQRQVERETACIDILTQISAVTHGLQQVAIGLVDQHLRRCVADAAGRTRPGSRPPRPMRLGSSNASSTSERRP